MCGLNTHRAVASEFSRRADATVLNVDYRMLPGNTVPNAVEDAVDGYRRLLDAGYEPHEVVIAGDSTGGHLAFTTALSLAKSGLPAPAAVATVSPLTDVRPERTRPDVDCPMLPGAALQAIVRYLRHCHRHIAVGHVWEGQMHEFTTATTLTPEGDEALDELSRFIVRNA